MNVPRIVGLIYFTRRKDLQSEEQDVDEPDEEEDELLSSFFFSSSGGFFGPHRNRKSMLSGISA